MPRNIKRYKIIDYIMLKIGLIDSGIGGISILKGLIDANIFCEYIYLFDDKYHPYGEKSESELKAIGYQNMKKLIEYGVDIVIIACNTLTSCCVDCLRKMFDIPIIGVEPAIKPASLECDKILLMATPFTVRSNRVQNLIKNCSEKDIYFPMLTNFANLIENNFECEEVLQEYLQEKIGKYKNIQGVVLGCTHYNFAKGIIEKLLNYPKIYTSVDGVVKQTKKIIKNLDKTNDNYLKISLISTKDDLELEKKYYLCKYIDFAIEFL